MLKNTKSLSKKWTDTHPSEVLKIVQSRDRYYVISHYPFPPAFLVSMYRPLPVDLGKKSIVHINPCVETWGSEGGGVRVDPGPTNSTSTYIAVSMAISVFSCFIIKELMLSPAPNPHVNFFVSSLNSIPSL